MTGTKRVWSWRRPTAPEKPPKHPKSTRVPIAVLEAVREALDAETLEKADQHVKNGGTIYITVVFS